MVQKILAENHLNSGSQSHARGGHTAGREKIKPVAEDYQKQDAGDKRRRGLEDQGAHGGTHVQGAAEDEPILEFQDEFYAFSFLSELADDSFNLSLLRQIAEENALVMALTRMSDARFLKYLASELVSGRIAIGHDDVRERDRRGAAKPPTSPAEETRDEDDEGDEAEAEAAPETDELTWIKFQILDHETGAPVRGVTLQVKLPNGKPKSGRTDGLGIIEFTDIPSGTCNIERMIDPDGLEVVSVS